MAAGGDVMHEAMLYEKLDGSRVHCNTCQWRCTINPSKTGVCRMYLNEGGALQNLNYALASSMAVDPIEKKPLFHFHPGTKVFSLGSWGCNFHCKGCQNWEISCNEAPDLQRSSRYVSPQAAVEQARREDCRGISWTYNEPTMWFEYTLDTAKLARQNGLYTVYVTNGYITPEAIDVIGPYLDAWRVDVKGFKKEVYRKLAKISHWEGILEVAIRAKTRWNMHIEVVTNLIAGVNDDDEQLRGLAHWIKQELGEMTPWHVTRFHPQFNMKDYPATPLSTLERAYDKGKKEGLKFVYIGNVPGHKSESTSCYSCGKTVVDRYGYHTQVKGLKGPKCGFCGTELNFVTSEERRGGKR